MTTPRAALVVLNDLMFRVKIEQALKASGYATRFVSSEADLFREAGTETALIVLDLNYQAVEPLAVIRKLKFEPATKSIYLLGYISHVQVDMRAEAVRAGCNQVVARSVLMETLARTVDHHA